MVFAEPLVPYALVRVAERLRPDRLLGYLLIESTFLRATYISADGRVATAEHFPSAELQGALDEVDSLTAGRAPGDGEWLGGIVEVFSHQWGDIAAVERAVFQLKPGQSEADAVRDRLRAALAGDWQQRSASHGNPSAEWLA